MLNGACMLRVSKCLLRRAHEDCCWGATHECVPLVATHPPHRTCPWAQGWTCLPLHPLLPAPCMQAAAGMVWPAALGPVLPAGGVLPVSTDRRACMWTCGSVGLCACMGMWAMRDVCMRVCDPLQITGCVCTRLNAYACVGVTEKVFVTCEHAATCCGHSA